ncbi:hypothetical protein [Pseudomonas sp. NBRC 111118]|uniref:hypothetical protein n=1 Tax=Pseudomonas sp. NBRC 111118 TaxID=1661033 RepID=UPI0012E2220B
MTKTETWSASRQDTGVSSVRRKLRGERRKRWRGPDQALTGAEGYRCWRTASSMF